MKLSLAGSDLEVAAGMGMEVDDMGSNARGMDSTAGAAEVLAAAEA